MRHVQPRLMGALGVLLVVAGAVVFAEASGGLDVMTYDAVHPEPESAYGSTLALSFDGGPLLAWTAGQAVGAALVVLGLLALAGLGGWWLGRRRHSATPA
jgi:LPXTG-motif cell wall-anchored protein